MVREQQKGLLRQNESNQVSVSILPKGKDDTCMCSFKVLKSFCFHVVTIMLSGGFDEENAL